MRKSLSVEEFVVVANQHGTCVGADSGLIVRGNWLNR